ncbi:hypothetical protein NDU88_002389 [Pleurodeles waltl]|uniref:protein-glutamine gamma-glutamyltransferase n=1 Tax=Pleurodeles waltl TaxID=8319 RepID=A0AAV7P995_PLEWA|nr:hypothetical protein NDU88_002389 [Pleurodeles waltl]
MEALRLLSVNLQLASNKIAHHCEDYQSNPELIVRRAQPFDVLMKFNRAPVDDDRLYFTMSIGPNPSEATGTKLTIPLTNSAASGTWSAVRGPVSANPLKVTITSSAEAIVGRYKMAVIISSLGTVTSSKLLDCIVLFNPWVQADTVYLPDEDERQEYVLSEHGIIYQGNVDHMAARGWNYGQFEKDILNITLSLMDKNSTTDHMHRSDPGYIGRVFSALVNSNDDTGVLIGNWNGDYKDEESPSRWNGSVAILRKFASTGPVRYGQCWVFAGVMCTALRCLGIPTRVITNFSSAHDTTSNLSIDVFYDIAGKYIGSPDSVWNFHVWNECWFRRKDLGPQNDGWQVLDATPQELSGGIYQLGPTSVKAVKNGDVGLPYDGPFVFSEVNADRKIWVYDQENEHLELIYSDTLSIGQCTRTKAVGSDDFEDVTGNYKHQEGSEEERVVYEKATAKLFGDVLTAFSASGDSGRVAARAPTAAPEPEVTCKFIKNESPVVGEDVNLVLKLTNSSSSAKAVKVNIDAACTTYTRREMKSFMSNSNAVTLGPKEEKELPVNIPYGQYRLSLTDDNVIEVSALCNVGQGGKVMASQTVTLKSPSINIKVVGQAVVNEKSRVDLTFSNPLSEELKDCEMHAGGSGLFAHEVTKLLSLKPKQTMRIHLDFTPTKKGSRQLQVYIKCNKFLNMKGFLTISVASQLHQVKAQA